MMSEYEHSACPSMAPVHSDRAGYELRFLGHRTSIREGSESRLSSASTARRRLSCTRTKEAEVHRSLQLFPNGQRDKLTEQYLEGHRALRRCQEVVTRRSSSSTFESRHHWKQNPAIRAPFLKENQPTVNHSYRNEYSRDKQRQLARETSIARKVKPGDPMALYKKSIGRKLPWE
ncbi:hypothetical protein DIPPA_07137 [Diplonema papillatum]|nr:hypothetical protein DIPPA_07137 [Diplonema papillatum]